MFDHVGRIDVDPEVKVPVRNSVFVAPLHVGLIEAGMLAATGR